MSEADKCKKLETWIDKMPGSNDNPTLHVRGTVMAPSPCHDPSAIYAGEEKTNPPTYLLNLRFRRREEACAEVETERDFSYKQTKYAGNHKFVKMIFSYSSSKKVEIKQVS